MTENRQLQLNVPRVTYIAKEPAGAKRVRPQSASARTGPRARVQKALEHSVEDRLERGCAAGRFATGASQHDATGSPAPVIALRNGSK